ncbi:MAG: MFS transporter [Dehalococcoidia bacterium]|nr:MFS transporter [Dehalococcoidia bacterium]
MGPRTIANALRRRTRGVYYGWRVTAAGFLINALADGTYFLGFTVLLLPISRDLGVSRTAISVPFSLARIIGGALGPIAGPLIDRFGPSRVLTFAALLGGLGFVLLYWTSSYTWFLVVYLGLVSVGMQSGFGAATATAVTQWFVRRRSLAMAVAQTGYSFGGAIIPPLFALGVQTVGWRATALIAGLGMWTIVLPLSTQLRRSPESMGMRPDGDPPLPEGAATDVLTPGRTHLVRGEVPVRSALHTPTYWMLAWCFGLRSMVWGAMGVHLVAIMVWKGISEPTSGYLMGFWALAWAPAVLLMGWLGDRWSKQKIAALGSFIAAGGVLMLALLDQVAVWQMLVVMLLLAPNEAGWGLGWAMIGDLFGRRHFATLRGGIIAVQSLMGVGAPVYSGWVYDHTGGYTWVLWPALALVVGGGLCFWFLPRPQVPEG